jgi:hypothetical protein
MPHCYSTTEHILLLLLLLTAPLRPPVPLPTTSTLAELLIPAAHQLAYPPPPVHYAARPCMPKLQQPAAPLALLQPALEAPSCSDYCCFALLPAAAALLRLSTS